ncbi:acyl-CoA dehydrogenase family protein [Rhodopila globiformis]|nr:acyl-CoA dehydrogenase family protein [Rhodopila globiformis]
MADGSVRISSPTDMVSAARNLAPLVRARRDEAEQLRRLPPDVAEAFAAAGLLQLYLPRSMGGPELPPLAAFEAIEELSRADGAAGWCAMIAGSLSLFAGWLPVEVGRAMAGEPANFRGAGSLRPEGRAVPVDGGYRVRGQWDFASGVHHANWLKATCVVMDGDRPRLTGAGTPQTLSMWVPAHQAMIKDTWSVVGMRGTGSHDFALEDVFVPEAHTYSVSDPPHETGPLYHPRLYYTSMWTATAANTLGIARGALDIMTDLASRRSSTMSTALLRDRPLVQARVAEAEAIVSAARTYLLSAVGTAWTTVCDGGADPTQAIAQARLAIVHGMHEAVRAVDLVFHAAGTNAVYTSNLLERPFRDIHVAVQHAAGAPAHYESAGKILLGASHNIAGW